VFTLCWEEGGEAGWGFPLDALDGAIELRMILYGRHFIFGNGGSAF
jgi:hypothetical protein